ncbi:MAG: helix-turn-helix transcriptional regulator [Candidatus Omnitrophica bacterium]|nr:helix-turn-helix transcriptional regulator [Candidatus Omnitrophota bacterium]
MSRKSSLAQNIKRLRKQLKLSQEELAKRAKVTYSTLIKIESGVNKNPTIITLKKLAKVLKVSLDELVEED